MTSTSHFEIGRERVELWKATYCKGASDAELMQFIEVCKRTGLAPEARQIYAIKRWDAFAKREVLQAQTSIDGFRVIAERSKQYAGQVGPQWCGPDGKWVDVWLENTPPRAARTGILRHDFKEVMWGVARWESYVVTGKDGRPQANWLKMPDLMLAKCFDTETEVLTEQGFKKFSAITHEKIAQVTSNGLEFVKAKPFSQAYSGEMIAFCSDDLNFCVTPNHDMITTSGRIEAGTMYDLSRARPSFFIPRIIPEHMSEGIKLSDGQIELAAAYIADGESTGKTSFRIKVSRTHKIDKLYNLNFHKDHKIIKTAGKTAVAPSGRVITTKNDQMMFKFDFSLINELVTPGKRLILETVENLNSAQCKVFIEAWAFFDGNKNTGGGLNRTLRIFTADENHADMIDLIAIKAGYATSRQFKITEWNKKCYIISLSKRNEIPVTRWGRFYKTLKLSNRKHRSLEIVNNESGIVWCVTVPSGMIVVRRHGFSMICGNCSESLALRRAFPNDLSGLYTTDEMDRTNNEAPPEASEKTEPKPKKEIAPKVEAKLIDKNDARWVQVLTGKFKERGWEAQIKRAIDLCHGKPWNLETLMDVEEALKFEKIAYEDFHE